MESNIKVGMEFECVKRYLMVGGEIAFIKGKIYKIHKVINNEAFMMCSNIDIEHTMIWNDNFHEHFKQVNESGSEMFERLRRNIKTLNNTHYQTDTIDVIDFCKLYDLNFNEGNVIKYVSRARRKGTHIQDLEKAIDYLKRELKYLDSIK